MIPVSRSPCVQELLADEDTKAAGETAQQADKASQGKKVDDAAAPRGPHHHPSGGGVDSWGHREEDTVPVVLNMQRAGAVEPPEGIFSDLLTGSVYLWEYEKQYLSSLFFPPPPGI